MKKLGIIARPSPEKIPVNNKNYYKNLFFLLILISSALVFLKIEIPMLLGADAEWSERIRPFELILHVHAFFGSAALAAGTIQFFVLNRQKYPHVHRAMGRFYIASVVISAPLAVWVAVYYGKPSEVAPHVAQSVIWLYATAAALFAIFKKDMVRHRIWMACSYALGFTFIITRFVTGILQLNTTESSGGSPTLLWLATIGALLTADLVTRWGKRQSASPG